MFSLGSLGLRSGSSAPPATGRGALKTFVIMQRLSRHFEELLGSERLQKVYQITAKKAGLSARAVESSKFPSLWVAPATVSLQTAKT